MARRVSRCASVAHESFHPPGPGGCALLLLLLLSLPASAAPCSKGSTYLGIFPSVLFEPDDEYDAVEVNLLPVTLGWRPVTNVGLELRPMMTLRLLEDQRQLTRVGGTLATHRYFARELLPSWVSLLVGPFISFTRSDIDRESVLILGGELGAAFFFSERFSLTFAVQPGMDYFLDTPVRGREWLPHFGLVLHFGWTFGGTGAEGNEQAAARREPPR